MQANASNRAQVNRSRTARTVRRWSSCRRGASQWAPGLVGAGFTGLSAALHLAELGVSVVVLESGGPGFGASGRNGGQVLPGLKRDPDELVARYGAERGDRLVSLWVQRQILSTM